MDEQKESDRLAWPKAALVIVVASVVAWLVILAVLYLA